MLTTLVSCLVIVHPVNAAETIYIKANGSLEGTTKQHVILFQTAANLKVYDK